MVIEKVVEMLSDYHIQVRVHAHLQANALDDKGNVEFSFYLKGFDFTVINPCGPLALKCSFMIRKLGLVHFFSRKRLPISRKKGIFAQEESITVDRSMLSRNR